MKKIAVLILATQILAPLASRAQGVRINEIMYAPISPEPQWIELYNTDSTNADIAGWSIVTAAGNVTIPTNLKTADEFIQYVVITSDSTALRVRRPGKYLIVQCSLPFLGSSGDEVVLKDPLHRTVDSLAYRPSWGGTMGASLERISSLAPSTDSTNWGTSIAPAGATPGQENSLSFPAVRNLALDSLTYALSNDSLRISVRIENRGNRALDSSILKVTSDSGNGASTLSSTIIGTVDADSAITEHLNVPFIAYRPDVLSIVIENPLDTIYGDDTLFFTMAGRAAPLSVVLNEIMFAPNSPEPEWIELLNTTNDTVDIGNWQIGVGMYSPATLDTINSSIAPGSLVIITKSPSQLAALDSISPSQIVHVNLPALSNGGSTIALYDPNRNLIDSVSYDGNWIKQKGISIERIDPSKPGYDASNWMACRDPRGSTILRPNSVQKRDYDLALGGIALRGSSLVLTVTNDGRNAFSSSAEIRIGSLDTFSIPASILIAPDSSLDLSVPIPANFFGRFPGIAYLTNPLDEDRFNDTLTFAIEVPIPRDSIVLNEIMFDPLPTSCEWLELYNPSTSWISLDSTRLVTGEKRPGEYVRSLTPLVIAPDSFGVVAADSSLFFQTYLQLNHAGAVTGFGVSTLQLGRDSCFLVLENMDSSDIDSLQYRKAWQQSLVRKTFAGISLERIDPKASSTDPNNWQASLDSAGATPLAPNSVAARLPHDTSLPAGTSFHAHFDPNPFSPEDNGFQNTSLLTIQTGNATSTWELRVRLYDTHGRMVRLLTDATTITGGTQLTFDGRRNNGQFLPPGVYAALIELTSQSPLRTMNKTVGVVIAGKRR